MSRMSDFLNRVEKIALKFEMSIEDIALILEGKHPTHIVTVGNPANPIVSAPASTPITNATVSAAPSAMAKPPTEAENPTTSGPAVASATVAVPSSAASTDAHSNV